MTIARDIRTGAVVGQVLEVPAIHKNAEGDTLTYSGIPGTVRVLTRDGEYKLLSALRVRLEEVH